MSTDFQSVDILLFAMIAVFLAIRLRNALGRKDRSDNKFEKKFDEQHDENFENIIELPGASKANNDVDVGENELGPEGGAALAEGLKGNTALQSLW